MRKTFAPIALLATVALFSAACSDPKEAARDHVARGDNYAKENKEPEAILQYRSAVDKDPQYGEARKKLGLAQLKAGNAKAALNQLVRAADLLPDDAEAQLAAGNILLRARQFEDAGTRADRVLAKDPKNVYAHILKANAAAGLKDLDGAITELEEAISLDPANTASYANLGAIEASRGRHKEAEGIFLKAIEVAPKSVEARLAIANYYWAVGRGADAVTALKAVLGIDAKNVAANRALGMFQFVSGNHEAAEAHFKAVVDNTTDPGPRLMLADFYVMRKRPQEATAILEELAKQPAAFADATSRLAGLTYIAGDKPKAHTMLDSVIAKQPTNIRMLYAKGTWLLLENRVDEAQKVADTALKAAPESIQSHHLAGTVLTRKGQFDEAIAEFEQVVKINSKAFAAQLELARLHEIKGASQVSKQYAREAVTLAPQRADARYALVRSLIASGDMSGAQRELEPLAKAAGDSYEVQLSLGRIALGRKDYTTAQSALERAVAKEPTGLEALTLLSGLEARNKQLPRAQALVRTALSKKPQDPGLLVLSARLDASTGQAAQAEQTLKRVIETYPHYLGAYEVLGGLYVSQRNLDAARQEYERLAAKMPKSVGAQTMVAMLHQAQGRTDDARAAYQRILALDSRAVVANNNLAYMYADEGKDLDMALQMAQTAKAASPDDADVNDTLGWVYYKKGMGVQAVGPLLQSTRINPSKPIYHYHLGLAYQQAGEKDKARAAIEHALSLGDFSDAPAARRALENLR